ncbi:MAG: YicC/YloC family endoribonuclease [Myxococcota bacterium]|nr:YicC/YloC family endoribonuclease [Myxococcota bacterium]
MSRSMTGYGRASVDFQSTPIEIEIRTVNHRHLDVRVRLPRSFGALDAPIKARVREHLDRGRVDVSLSFGDGEPLTPRLHVDVALAGQYQAAAEQLSAEHGLDVGLDAGGLLSMSGVVTFSEPWADDETLAASVLDGVSRALQGVSEMRGAEGEVLRRDLETRLDAVEALAIRFESRSGEVVEAVREKWKRRLEQLEMETHVVDPGRLHQEIVLASDRLDITEELARIRSHVSQFRGILAEDSAVGRRLDFLLQEMAREANTVGSKASDALLAQDVVELKTELERMREQVQNLE